MKRRASGFSLVEVVLAMGVCAFALVSLMALFQVGLKSGRETEDQIEAANLASQIVARLAASPTNTNVIPSGKISQTYSNAFAGTTNYIGFNGVLTNTPASAAYRITCFVGTNALTGSKTAQLYLLLSWPPGAASSNALGKYETLTFIPLP